MKATLKKINEYLATLTEYGDDIELKKAHRFFYFSRSQSSLSRNEYPFWVAPVPIHVCYLNHMSLEDWNKHVKWRIEEWDTKDGKEAEGEK